MNIAQKRHDTMKWKKRRTGKHGDKCSNARCGVCHPHKCVGGNHKGRVKKKYEFLTKDLSNE